MTSPTLTPAPPRQAASKAVVLGSVLLILVGAAAWNAWDWVGTEGLDPKRVKEMARAYEDQVCAKATGDVKACKRHIGRHHRECLPSGVKRPPQDPRGAPSYDDAGYAACMEQRRAASGQDASTSAGPGPKASSTPSSTP